MRRRPKLFSLSATVGSTALLVVSGMVMLALRVPPHEILAALPDRLLVDVDRWTGAKLQPLTGQFVTRALGSGPLDRALPLPTPNSSDPSPVAPGTPQRATMQHDDRLVVAHASSNDRRNSAYTVPSLPFTARTDTTAARREPEEPSDCAATGGTVWYRYTPDRDRRLFVSTLGTRYPLVLGIFEVGPDGRLRRVDCALGTSGNAESRFTTRAGTTYLFQITGPAGGGELVFNLDAAGTHLHVADHSNFTRVALSSDGSRVAYLNDHRTAVFVSDLTTGQRWEVHREHRVEPFVARSVNPAVGSLALSGDGRYAAFHTTEALVADDTNRHDDVYVHDLATGTSVRASLSSDGQQGWLPGSWLPEQIGPAHNNWSWPSVSLSHDGRYVAFTSELAGLVEDDEPRTCTPYTPSQPVDVPYLRCKAVFVRDLVAGSTVRVSIGEGGTSRHSHSYAVEISADGRYLAFVAEDHSALVASSRAAQVYLHDRDADGDGRLDEPGAVTTTLASVSPDGAPGDGDSGMGQPYQALAVSGDGQRVAYWSHAGNLHPDRGGTDQNLYVFDARAGRNELVPDTWREWHPDTLENIGLDLSSDGGTVAFAIEVNQTTVRNEGHWGAILLYDLRHRTLTRLPPLFSGEEEAWADHAPSLSADSRYVALVTHPADCIERETCHALYVYERPTRDR